MSVGIVRVQKFTSGSVRGIEIHDQRTKGMSHTNPDIDWERSSQNYDLHLSRDKSYYSAVKERIDQLNLSKAVRKDAIVMAQVLVTSDHEFFQGLSNKQQEQFFKDSYNFLAKRYGEKNIISATVHLDERTPHMHFNFVPVTDDGRLSAKTIFTRTSLTRQHDDFYASVGREWGLLRGESGGYKKHVETTEYKKQTAYAELTEIEKKLTEAQSKITELQVAYDAKREGMNKKLDELKSHAQNKINELKTEIGQTKKELFAHQALVAEATKNVKREKAEEENLRKNIVLLRDEIKSLELKHGDMSLLAKELENERANNDILNDVLAQLNDLIYALGNTRLQREADEAMSDMPELKRRENEEAYHAWKQRGGNYGR